jgi:AcrR family transcriptional regulator
MAVTARGLETRARLLDATASLVAQHGFHAVGIADIGAAAGVSGAAIYRHYPTKTALLVALLDRVVDELLAGATEAGADLDDLVRAHVTFALHDRALLAVWNQESRNLPPDDRRRLVRKQRAYVDRWADALAPRLPRADRDEVRARVHAALGLVNSVSDFSPRVPHDRLAAVLHAAAMAALTAKA